MSPDLGVSVSGAALTPYNRRKDGSNFRDWAFDAFEQALTLSTLERGDIDALFVSSESDFFTCQLNPAAVLASDLGLRSVETLRCEGGGASGQLAVHAATRAVQCGRVKHAAVVGVDPSASHLSGDTVTALYGYSFDAWTDGMTGLSSTALYALSFQAFREVHKVTDRDLATVTIRNRSNALGNPNAHLGRNHTVEEVDQSPLIASPYRRLHCSPLSDGAAALILSGDKHTPQARTHAPKIAGIGGAVDTLHLGARADPGIFSAKTRAMRSACEEADILPEKIELAEIYDAYAGAQLQGIQALGLSDNVVDDLNCHRFSPGGKCPVNLSGGLLGQGAPVGATGVGQTATCALLLEGRYHPPLQPDHPPHYALADTHGGICTTAAVTILKNGEAA